MVSTEVDTIPLVAYVENVQTSKTGSGVLFYPGGEDLFIFTCAHVADGAGKLRLILLLPQDPDRDEYQPWPMEASVEQICYSPLDKVEPEDGCGEKDHSEDIAVIRVAKPAGFDIDTTSYLIAEPRRGDRFYAQGYPNGMPPKDDPMDYLERLDGSVVSSRGGSNHFNIRMADPFLDHSNRLYELRGMSGGPVWRDAEGVDHPALYGLVSQTQGPSAERARVRAMKASRFRTLMYDEFGIGIERWMDGMTEGDDLVTQPVATVAIHEVTRPLAKGVDKWLEGKISACRECIRDLQLAKAIGIAANAIGDDTFELCDPECQKVLMKHLLYCYEITDLDDEFDALEEDMRKRGFLEKFDTLRHLTRAFGRKAYEEVATIARDYLASAGTDVEGSMAVIANAFLLLARAFTEELPVEETVDRLLDSRELLVDSAGDEENDALLYQMIGYVYGERYHNCAKSVRLMERSFRIGFDGMVLESLGAAYYFLSISEATKLDGTIDHNKLDMRSLGKARECFLDIMDKADTLSWAATIRRVGLCVYDTFAFLNDSYRVLTVYPDLHRYAEAICEPKVWRNVEMAHGRVVALSGAIDTSVYPHLHREDRLFLRALATSVGCTNNIHRAVIDLTPGQLSSTGLDRYLKDAVRDVEEAVRRVRREDRTQLYIQLLNMYGRGIAHFGWEASDKVGYCMDRLRDSLDDDSFELLEIYALELGGSHVEAERCYREVFDRRKDMHSWSELNHFYVRHGQLDEAERMYRNLLTVHREVIEDDPEQAYRAYMEFVIDYRRDIKDALQCFLDAKSAFHDTDIMCFWELELMLHTDTFNEPERFEAERRPFLEKGLISEGEFHRVAFIAYLANLEREKADEHAGFIVGSQHLLHPVTRMPVARLEEIHYLNWIGAYAPGFHPPYQSMTDRRSAEVRSLYAKERWHRQPDISMRNRFAVDRSIAIDAWGLYVLYEEDGFRLLETFDNVYVPHASVIHLLDELSRTNNEKIRGLLNAIKSYEAFTIVSPGFEAQMTVRNAVTYAEPAATVALSVEKGCVSVIGFPELGDDIIERYGRGLVRPNEIGLLLVGGSSR